ncbi:hypothetical protein ACFSFY_08045 [Sporosarcina siberiensis]|uniref:Uncharacterized protein n=1 Tax=Sporosarcina siberiensis TaxID=1365606 RepID=A0ABW4SET1_9BACL
MWRWIPLLLLSVLLLVSCTIDNTIPNVDTEKTATLPGKVDNSEEESNEESVEQTETDLSQFFLPDKTTAYFKGDGIEFSTYTSRTEWLGDHHVNVFEDNGGVELVTSYRLEDDTIVVLQEVPKETEIYTVTIEELDKMQPIRDYLTFPLEVGTVIDKWTVVSISEELDTPLQFFSNVIVLEQQYEEEAFSRSYFAVGFGEIKREYIAKENGNIFEVTSVIESIE